MSETIEVRIHGRGGQGSVTAAELLAVAAFEDGKFSQAFPAFGVERRGAPVRAFTRISDEKIRNRSQVYEPDVVIVQDPTLIEVVDVVGGLEDDGMVIVNTDADPSGVDIETDAEVRTIDATSIAIEHLGRPIMNTTLMGAFSGATKYIQVESIERSVKERFPGELGEKNVNAIRAAYDRMVNE